MTVERRMLMASAGKTLKVSTTGPFPDDSNYDYYSYDVAANPVNGNFIRVGYDYNTGECISSSSTDQGLTFAFAPKVIDPNGYMYCIACGNDGKWIAGGVTYRGGGVSYAFVVTSTDDGATWTNLTRIGFSAVGVQSFPPAIGTDGNGTWIATINVGPSYDPYYVISTDNGVTWSAQARFNGYTTSSLFTSVDYINGKWIVTGYTNPATSTLVTTSTNGTTWTTPSTTTLNFSVGGGTAWNTGNIAVRPSDSLAIAGGQSGNIGYRISTNQTTWSAVANPPSAATIAGGSGTIQYNPVTGNFVMLGKQTTGNVMVYWVSKDGGTTWSAKTNMYTGNPSVQYFYSGSAVNKYGRIVWISQYWGYGSIINA